MAIIGCGINHKDTQHTDKCRKNKNDTGAIQHNITQNKNNTDTIQHNITQNKNNTDTIQQTIT
jgi:hypothetical protein